MFTPFSIIGTWFRGLFALLLIGGGIYLLTQWNGSRETVVVDPVPAVGGTGDTIDAPAQHRTVSWQFGLNPATYFLLGSIALLAWSFGGGWLASPRTWRRSGNDEPVEPVDGHAQFVQTREGQLRVLSYGPVDGEPVVLTHGWGLDHNEWSYTLKALSAKYRVITWDLPGLGESDRPADRDWSLEKQARDLHAVIGVANKPVVLVGHSIGVMITLTYCKLFPENLSSSIRGLVLAQGTYTNPLKTMSMAGLYLALQKPVLEPLCHLMVWFSPIVRVMNWLSYLNGSAHRSTERSSFSGHETRGQLDFMSSYYCKSAPDVVARGMLAMFRYDATNVLATIPIPTMVVAGDLDTVCLPEASRHIANTIPDGHLIVLEQSKHCGLFEHHEVFNDALVDFLSSPERMGHGDTKRMPVVPVSVAN